MQTEKRRKPAPVFTARLMLNLPQETFALIQREAEEKQMTMAGLARSIIARSLASERRRPSARVEAEAEARAA